MTVPLVVSPIPPLTYTIAASVGGEAPRFSGMPLMVLLVEPSLIVVVLPSKSIVTVVVLGPCLIETTCVLWVLVPTVIVPAVKVTWSAFPCDLMEWTHPGCCGKR